MRVEGGEGKMGEGREGKVELPKARKERGVSRAI